MAASNSSTTAAAFARAAPQLLETGYAVVDDAISPALAAELHACCAALHESRVLRQHRFGFRPSASAKPQIFEKPHIFECELGEPQFLASEHAQRLLAALAALDCAESARAAFPELRLLPGDDAVTVKLQCNEGGGGCFPLHYDNAGPPSKRRLTCLVYLNPGWADGDGGELQLAPWLRPPVDVAPLCGRVVLFNSETMLHRTLPANARRFCFTVWIDGADSNGPGSLSLVAKGRAEDTCLGLAASPAQRVLSRAVYAEAYAQSLEDCLRGTHALGPMLASHDAHVAASAANAPLARLVDAARGLARRAEEPARVELRVGEDGVAVAAIAPS